MTLRPYARPFQRIFRNLGIEVLKRQPDHHYVPLVYGRSAHKHLDIRSIQPFGKLATRVIEQRRTLLYYDRLFTLYQALDNVRRLAGSGPVNTAEAGVYKGGSSYFLAATGQEFALPGHAHHAFDTFEGHAKQDLGALDPHHTTATFRDTEYEQVKQYLSAFPNVEVLKGRIQDNAARVGDKPFHLVHLDMDIYEPTLFALEFFDQRLVVGGIFVVDDYGYISCPGAKSAVDEFVAARPGYTSIHLLTGQCVLVKTGA